MLCQDLLWGWAALASPVFTRLCTNEGKHGRSQCHLNSQPCHSTSAEARNGLPTARVRGGLVEIGQTNSPKVRRIFQAPIHNIRHRCLHTQLGRLISRDPIGCGAAANLFSGVGCDKLAASALATGSHGIASAGTPQSGYLELPSLLLCAELSVL